MGEAEDKIYHFAGFALDLRRGALRFGTSEIELRPKGFALLRYLIENAGRLVSKDELIEAVWSDVIVTDDSLTRCVSDVRRAVRDDDQKIIKTVLRRGYLFVAEIMVETGQPAQAETETPPAPPPRAVTNLPQPLAAMIGREREMAELPGSIERHRLVTLAGPSGIGKTRLSIELGHRMLAHFAGGVWLVDLAPLTDPAVVTSAVASVLGVALNGAGEPVEAIAAALGTRPRLLIFDNCEHLIGAAVALVEKLLARAPLLSVLATSQEVFGLPAEEVYRLDPLGLPPPDATEITQFGAVALFVERAHGADRGFGLDRDNAAAIGEICRRLDGIPLTLEMAASRVALLGIEGLRARLDERLQLLTTGPRTAETRHRTLRAMVAWSYGLLDSADQRVFLRLAAFAGSFSLDAAIAIAGEAEPWAMVDALGRLVDKSLVTIVGGAAKRYRLLETLRLYAGEYLAASGENAAVAERHARYFTDLFDRAYEEWETTPDAEWRERYRVEIDNVRSALDWAYRDQSRAVIAISLTGSAAPVWEKLSLLTEGRVLVDRAMALIDQATPPAVAARLFRMTGILWYSSDRLRALGPLERSASIYRELDDRLSLGTVLGVLGLTYSFVGRNAEAKAALQEGQKLLSTTDRVKSLLNILNNLGLLAFSMSEIEEARSFFERALDVVRPLKDNVREVQILANLAEVEFGSGAIDRAIELGWESVSRLRSAENRHHFGLALVNLASYLIAQDDLSTARTIVVEALSVVREHGGFLVRICLQQWALLYCLEQRFSLAARLIGFVDNGFAEAEEVRQPTEQQSYDRLMRLLAKALSVSEIRDLRQEGVLWSEREAVIFVLEHTESQLMTHI